jgi:hypothetical protein
MNASEQDASHALVCFYDTEDEAAVNLAPYKAALILQAIVDECAGAAGNCSLSFPEWT